MLIFFKFLRLFVSPRRFPGSLGRKIISTQKESQENPGFQQTRVPVFQIVTFPGFRRILPKSLPVGKLRRKDPQAKRIQPM